MTTDTVTATITTEGGDMAARSEQARLLQDAKEALGITSAELAERLGVSHNTLRAWLCRSNTARYREMPKTAKLLLARILSERKAAKGRK